MKKVWLPAWMLVMLLTATTELSAMEAPMDIVRNTTDEVLNRVKSDRDALRQDPAKMYMLVSEVIFPHFDFPIMAQWVLGTHWKSANEDSRTEFVQQFRKLLVRTFDLCFRLDQRGFLVPDFCLQKSNTSRQL